MKFKLYAILVVVTCGIILGLIFYQLTNFRSKTSSVQNIRPKQNLKIFTFQEIGNFNGTDPEMPIYLALDGFVYDVTKGKEFYQLGAPYHYLAGRDSSNELHLIGGDIIKKKYPIIGKLSVINK
ncbi:MAG: cytochrome b5 domain-containing protein [Patescibacteria group bacterium]|jgi:predicted heme/steroid binding protein